MTDGAGWLIGLVIFIILVLVNMVLYGFGSATRNINESQVAKKALEGDKKSERIMKLIDNPEEFVTTNHIFGLFTAAAIGVFAVKFIKNCFNSLYEQDFGVYVLVCLLAILILVALLISFGIVIPKKVAFHRPEKWAYSLVGLVFAMVVIFKPFSFIVISIGNIFVKICGIDPNDDVEDVTEDDILSMVNEGHEQGAVLESEAEMINNIFELDDKDAKDIMTHRSNMVCLDVTKTLEEALDFILEQNFSRFPVFEDNIDNIIGVIHIKDVMIEHNKEVNLDRPLSQFKNLIREVSFIPETRDINELFKSMQGNHMHMAVVVDEYGQTAGIVTMEDILEEIVGNILDEYDEEDTTVNQTGEHEFIIDAQAELEDVLELLEIELSEDEVEEYEEIDTLNGLLITLLDKIPEEDEKIVLSFKGYEFTVLKVENKMIKSVRVTMEPVVAKTSE